MRTVQKLRLAAAVFSLTGAIVGSFVWGDGSAKRTPLQPPSGKKDAPEIRLGDGLAGGKFADNAVVAYTTQKGETLIGAQIKPALEQSGARPRDLAVLIDTSASQAGSSYDLARKVTKALGDTLTPNDLVSIWVINTPKTTKSLTGDTFVAANSDKVKAAIGKLENEEYCDGATDLKNALQKVLSSFDSRAGRQSAIVLLGDGESAFSPVSNAERSQIAQDMVARQVAFFAVPLGVKLNPSNLHGFASTTGGTIVRTQLDEAPVDFCKRLLNTVSGPILYPTRYELVDGALEAVPTKLPPLRSDSPTLMVGKVKPGTAEFALKVEGTLNGAATQIEVREKISPPDVENYFLVGMFDQWSHSVHKAAPALIRADRAMAYAKQQSRLMVEEYVTQAQWALTDNRLDVADRLYGMALKVDPNDLECQAGLEVVKKLKSGTVTQKQLIQMALAEKKGQALKIQGSGHNNGDIAFGQQTAKTERINFAKLLATSVDQDDPKPAGAGSGPANPAPTDPDLLRQAQQRQALLEQQIKNVVDETIRRAKSMLGGDPDGAYDLLKRQKAAIADNPELVDAFKQGLSNRLETQMREVDSRGRLIKQRLAEETERKILAERQKADAAEQAGIHEKTRERVRAFVTLMNQARYEEAYKESLILQQEHISKGLPVPIEATASYNMALTATNLRELQELKRIREERFLLTLMQVEKSHVPYPDEPPVHFPPATVWKQLSDFRKDRYDGSGLGPQTPERTKKLSKSLSQVVDIERPIDASLRDVLEFLSDRFELTIIVDPTAFANADPPQPEVENTRVKVPKLPGVTLSTVLRLILSPIGGTYLVRRDYIEITTGKEAIKEKTVRAFEVADLVIPIPNSVNQTGLQQNLSVLGGAFSFGNAGSPFTMFTGIGGGIVGVGGGVGGLGGGALGGGAGIGVAGGGAGGLLGAMGGFGAGGNNLGAGGGVTGFGGGQLGQFGNLGGQFGLQGGDQSAILVKLITDVVARGEWSRTPANVNSQLGAPVGQMMMDPDDDPQTVAPSELNTLGYYPPARALVVRATSRIHTRAGGGLLNAKAGGGMMGQLPNDGRDRLVFGGPKIKDDDQPKNADPKKDAMAQVDRNKEYENAKPNKIITQKDWQEAFAKEKIKDKAGWVIAITDFLSGVHEFGQAADVLKTNLRLGFVNDPWVFEALAIALEESHASPDEIERAKLSCIDLDPTDPQAYLQAAESVAKMGQYERAVGFCRQASALQPEAADPYSSALAYLGKLKDVDSDSTAWAVTNLLKRDWSADSERYHASAEAVLAETKVKLEKANRGAEVAKIQGALLAEKRRDLVIELNWDGEADLDLRVIEPIGTECSSSQRETPAGSHLDSDSLKRRSELYTVAEAFTGSYEVKVDRVWGRTIGGKAQVKVVRHQGTPEEFVEYHTINVDKNESLKIPLTGGRRTALAAVAPPINRGHPDTEKVASNMDRAVQRLKALADPTYSGGEYGALRSGGVGSSGRKTVPVYDMSGTKPTASMTALTKVDGDGADLTAKTSVTTNKNGETEIRVKVAPVYETAKMLDTPVIENPLIPGAK